ncbi:MAG: ImmA/IrrE family metallo-endopeptidase [Planctomycetaceae bacterium]|nr:ImmA/IrrE family metallo-endopeptidase [Planctomycetaceae bacterium]
MPTIAVKPELIQWAIDRSGVSTEILTQKFPKLEEWKSGRKQPTFLQLEAFARATMAPFGAMFLDGPPVEELPIPDFRTKNDRPVSRFSPNLIETIHTIQQRQDWMREWLTEEGTEEIDFVGSIKIDRNIKSTAQRIRQRLELDADWAESLPNWESALQTLRSSIERMGVLVFSNSVVGLNNHRPLDPEEFRGFVLSDRIAPAVFLNDADTKSARIFTLVHELVHLWLGQNGVFNLEQMMPAQNEIEKFCNRTAAEFLIPEYKLTTVWKEAKETSKPFSVIARIFKVSPVVAARRALDLKFIQKAEFFRFYEQDREEWLKLKSENRKKKSGGDFYRTQNVRLGRKFSAAVVRAVREGKMPHLEAFRLTGLKGETFQSYSKLVLDRVRDERE